MQILSEIDLGEVKDTTLNIAQLSAKDFSNLQGCDVEVVVCSRGTATKLLNANLPNLKLIQLTSAGFDGVPLEEYRKKGVSVANVSEVYGIPIAETVVFGMLEIAKRIHVFPENRTPKLTRGYASTITELSEKTVIILGAGNIGTEIAKRLSGFNMNIIAYARHKKENPWFDGFITDRLELFEILKKVDYVVSTLPDNENSKGFISTEFLQAMNHTAYFINVGRRKTIDEEALYRALKHRNIQGAILDMFEKLPNPVTNKFRRLSNVIVWPGLSAISKETNERLKQTIIKNLIELERGEPHGVVN